MGNRCIGEVCGKDGLVLISNDNEYDLKRIGREVFP